MAKNWIKYVILVLFNLVLMLFYHTYFFFITFIVSLVLPVLSWLIFRNGFKKVSLAVDTPVKYIEEQEEIPVKFTVTNDSIFPFPGLKIFFHVENHFYPNEEQQEMSLPVRAHRSVTYGWGVKSIYAGRMELHADSLVMRDYLGMFQYSKTLDINQFSDCYPVISRVASEITEPFFTEGNDDDSSTSYTEDVTSIRDIRDYVPGDRLQKVHWKLSTKSDSLLVKEFDPEQERVITLLVELKRDSEKLGFLDDLITAFYSTAKMLIDMDMNFQVMWYDSARGRLDCETIHEDDGLQDVMGQIFIMDSYTDGCRAYEKYAEEREDRKLKTVYFTSPDFAMPEDGTVLGRFQDKVLIVCI